MEARWRNPIELRTEPLEVIPEKAGLEPKMVRFEPVLIMLRLRTDGLKMGQTLKNSFPLPADG